MSEIIESEVDETKEEKTEEFVESPEEVEEELS